MIKKTGVFLCIVLAAAFLGGCGDEFTSLSELNTGKYVELGEYTGLEVSVPVMEVTEEYIDNYIGFVLSDHSEWTEVTEERPARMGDTVNIDFVGKIDGEAFDGGSFDGYSLLLGSGSFIPGFEEGVVGMKKGETKDVTAVFPEPYKNNPDLSGMEAVFTVTVHEIREKQIPELTDAFVSSLDVGCDTVEEYREYVRGLGEKSAMEMYENNVEESLLSKAMAACTIQDPPKKMADHYYDISVRKLSSAASAAGVSLETLVGAYGMTMEQYEQEARAQAEADCREDMMLQAIANQEKITVSREEIDAAAAEEAERDGYASADDFQAVVGGDYCETIAMRRKVIAFLRENALITE